jgi:hypothetical protein
MRIFSIIVALSVLASGQGAFAFDEKVAPTAKQPSVPGITIDKASTPGASGVELNLSTPQAATGTEIQIPGLGTIGVLPKMDFGLELLYGANNTGAPESQFDLNAQEELPDALTVRGQIKNKF